MIEEAIGYTATIHDALGRLVPIEVLPAAHHLRINTSNLEEGIYYLTIFDDTRRLGNTEKIVILR